MGNMGSNSYGGMQPGSGAGLRGGLPEEKNVAQVVSEHTNVYARKFQILLDKSTPHTMERWLFTFGIFLLFGLNVVLRQGVSLITMFMAKGRKGMHTGKSREERCRGEGKETDRWAVWTR